MVGRNRANPRAAAPGILAEDAIVDTLERDEDWGEGVTPVDPQSRHEMIAQTAYYISEQRGFAPGHEQADWYRAEAAIDRQLPRVLAHR